MKKIVWTIVLACVMGIASGQSDQGLRGEYFEGSAFEKKVMTRTDAQINFVWDNTAPVKGMDPERFSIRWRGKIKTPETGTYTFRAHVDDGIIVKVNNTTVIDAWDLHDSERFTGSIYLEAGRYYDLYVSYFNGMLEGEIQLFWQLPSETGKRDQIISSKHFYTKVPPPPPVVVATPKPKPKQPVKPATKPTPKKTPTIVKQTETPKPVEPVREVEMALPEVPVKAAAVPADTLKKYIPRNVLFVQTKPTILEESYPGLDKLSRFLVNNPNLRLSIAGHTDKLGNPANNLKLSEARAQTVANYLIEKGVAADRITTKGYGDTKPLIKKPHVKNRRVEFLVY